MTETKSRKEYTREHVDFNFYPAANQGVLCINHVPVATTALDQDQRMTVDVYPRDVTGAVIQDAGLYLDELGGALAKAQDWAGAKQIIVTKRSDTENPALSDVLHVVEDSVNKTRNIFQPVSP